MPLPLAPLLLAAAAAAAAAGGAAVTPAPTATATSTPNPTAAPAAAGAAAPKPRSLADVARERKLVPLKGTAETSPEASGPLRVEDLQDNGAVSDGLLSLYGRVRNTGRSSACHVRLFLRTFDEHGILLAKGETTTDLKTILPGDAVPFGARLKVPPGVRGSQERAPDVLAEGPARTNWQRVARVESEILDFSEDCR